MTELQNPSVNSSNSAFGAGEQYAQQWIDFLRKRNSMLAALLFLTVIFALFMGLAAFYFHQQGLTAKLENSLANTSRSKLETELADQLKQMSDSSSSYSDIKTKYDDLEQEFGSQAQQLKEAESSLAINQELVDNLNAQVALLKEENKALDGSLGQMRQSLLSGASNSEVITIENKRLNAEVVSLNKKLRDRKGAYLAVVKRQKESQSEIDRLSRANDKLELGAISLSKKTELLESQVSQLSKSNTALLTDLDESVNKNKILEDKLSSLMSPIGLGDTDKSDVRIQPKLLTEGSVTTGFEGLEEIKDQKPKVVTVTNSKKQEAAGDGSTKDTSRNSFDYNQISVH